MDGTMMQPLTTAGLFAAALLVCSLAIPAHAQSTDQVAATGTTDDAVVVEDVAAEENAADEAPKPPPAWKTWGTWNVAKDKAELERIIRDNRRTTLTTNAVTLPSDRAIAGSTYFDSSHYLQHQ